MNAAARGSRAQRERLAEARRRLRVRIESIAGAHDYPRFDEALTHPSFSNEVSGVRDNQRLEFLGDAVLGLCVSELLVTSHPDADEGALSRIRSGLVNAGALAEWARKEGVGEAIALGKGARAGSEREQTNVLADAVESLVACVYEAAGLAGARALVASVVCGRLLEAEGLAGRDPKSELQERVQAEGKPPPGYRVQEVRGPQHDPTFVVEVYVGEELLGTGEGRSKRSAERRAAEDALRQAHEGAPA